MLKEIFPNNWWEMAPSEFNKARADLFAMTEAVDRDKDKSLKDVSILNCFNLGESARNVPGSAREQRGFANPEFEMVLVRPDNTVISRNVQHQYARKCICWNEFTVYKYKSSQRGI